MVQICMHSYNNMDATHGDALLRNCLAACNVLV